MPDAASCIIGDAVVLVKRITRYAWHTESGHRHKTSRSAALPGRRHRSLKRKLSGLSPRDGLSREGAVRRRSNVMLNVSNPTGGW